MALAKKKGINVNIFPKLEGIVGKIQASGEKYIYIIINVK